MTPIQPCLWFDRQAEEAAKLYTSLFRHAKLGDTARYGKAGAKASGQPESSVMTVEFELEGLRILALNGGPHFQLDPTVSFFVAAENEPELERLWKGLCHQERMALGTYPWSPKYGWCEDRFGVNWQLILGPRRQKISPALLFANRCFGKAEEAMRLYTQLFPDSKLETVTRDEKSGAVLHGLARIGGVDFVFFEGPIDPKFGFSCAFSFIATCESQRELDAIWSKLSAVPEAERCGWLRDPFGVSWQVIPGDWRKMLREGTSAQKERLMAALMQMKKPDLETLRIAYRG